MGVLQLVLLNLIILVYGVYRAREEMRRRDFPPLCMILGKDENVYIEGVVRHTTAWMRRRGVPKRLVLFIEAPGGETAVIARKLAQDLSIIAWEMMFGAEIQEFIGKREPLVKILDLRGVKGQNRPCGLVEKWLRDGGGEQAAESEG
ncbi:MAG: hypothetical protein QHH10_05730 [Peptococcaceae bacterium]|nr:hypothetical protein [Peptococcaceae bacterium]MDH7524801.1 hypothetical protein [Peptococcaceae bacterium]